jgi:CheY-like chemotaxis protein
MQRPNGTTCKQRSLQETIWIKVPNKVVVRSVACALVPITDVRLGEKMKYPTKNFGETAKSLTRNPLGIIALFIVLVYGFASLVTASADSFTSSERRLLIYFLIFFPVFVLAIFAWLVSKHSGKLFAPSDFKNEDNYVKMQMLTIASLSAASAKRNTSTSEVEIEKIVNAVRTASPAYGQSGDEWGNHILWVDDRPENNTYERQAFETMGLRFTLALSTNEAISRLSQDQYAVIISDMSRREGSREGYVLLDRIRRQGDQTPLFFYSTSNETEHKRETKEHGGQGCTNNAQELFEMVMRAVIQRRKA